MSGVRRKLFDEFKTVEEKNSFDQQKADEVKRDEEFRTSYTQQQQKVREVTKSFSQMDISKK